MQTQLNKHTRIPINVDTSLRKYSHASQKLSEQDVRIAGLVHEQKKPSVVVINKWDLVEKNQHTMDFYKSQLDEDLKFMSYYVPVFVSAKTGQRVDDIMQKVLEVFQNASRQTSTSILNEILQDAVSLSQPPSRYGKRIKFFFISQNGTNPPKFVIQTNESKLVHYSYQRYLENCLRRNIQLSGTPIEIVFKDKKED